MIQNVDSPGEGLTRCAPQDQKSEKLGALKGVFPPIPTIHHQKFPHTPQKFPPFSHTLPPKYLLISLIPKTNVAIHKIVDESVPGKNARNGKTGKTKTQKNKRNKKNLYGILFFKF